MSSAPMTLSPRVQSSEDEWVEVVAPRSAMPDGNARIITAIAAIRRDIRLDNPSSLELDPSATYRPLDELDEEFGRYSAERWDD
jgi:hypothetical protein